MNSKPQTSSSSSPAAYAEAILLGQGAFARVFKVPNFASQFPKFYADKVVFIESFLAKRARQSSETPSKSINFLWNEVRALSKLNSDLVIKYYNCVLKGPNQAELVKLANGQPNSFDLSFLKDEDSKYIHGLLGPHTLEIWTECCDTDLQKWINSKSKQEDRDLAECGDLALQLLQGLEYVHSKGFIHRDLKPANVFLTAGKLKIGDFGLSRDSNSTSSLTLQVGTERFQSPEMWGRQEYDCSTDIFSAGIVIFELFLAMDPRQCCCLFELQRFYTTFDKVMVWTNFLEPSLLLKNKQLVEFFLKLTSYYRELRPKASEALTELKELLEKLKDKQVTTEIEEKYKLLVPPVENKDPSQGEWLGTGNFGKVFKVEKKQEAASYQPTEFVAKKVIYLESLLLKRLLFRDEKPEEAAQFMWNSLEILPELNHKNLVKYHSFQWDGPQCEDFKAMCMGVNHNLDLSFMDDMRYVDQRFSRNTLTVWMEHCDIDLNQWFVQHPLQEERDYWICRKLVKQLLEALVHIHSRGVIHRNLTASNIFICGRIEKTKTLKIGDFGFTKKTTVPNKGQLHVGSERYQSPEMNQLFHVYRHILCWCYHIRNILRHDLEAT